MTSYPTTKKKCTWEPTMTLCRPPPPRRMHPIHNMARRETREKALANRHGRSGSSGGRRDKVRREPRRAPKDSPQRLGYKRRPHTFGDILDHFRQEGSCLFSTTASIAQAQACSPSYRQLQTLSFPTPNLMLYEKRERERDCLRQQQQVRDEAGVVQATVCA